MEGLTNKDAALAKLKSKVSLSALAEAQRKILFSEIRLKPLVCLIFVHELKLVAIYQNKMPTEPSGQLGN